MPIGDSYRRKIQLIAGVTYSISLPKAWVKKNNLKDKHELTIREESDGSLIVSPSGEVSATKIDTFEVNIDTYTEDVSQILFVLYYMGVENITLFSKKEMTFELKARVKDTLTDMIGTEIVYEDQQRIKIRVLLDKSKVDINQLFYRISLLINGSIDLMFKDFNVKEITRNEEEIDRLYHLIAKIIFLSQFNTDILLSSNIKKTYYLTSYLLIGKKLENIGDSLNNLAEYLNKHKTRVKSTEEVLLFLMEHLDKGMKYFMNKGKRSFTKTGKKVFSHMEQKISKLHDHKIIMHLDDALRFLEDVEEELTNISFYNKLHQEKML